MGDIGDPSEVLVYLVLMVVMVGVILMVGALCRKVCCPEDVGGSYVSVMLEGGAGGVASQACGDTVSDPVTDAAADWVRVEDSTTEAKEGPGGTQESETEGPMEAREGRRAKRPLGSRTNQGERSSVRVQDMGREAACLSRR